LANLFLGLLAFRAILALETFLNSQEINALIDSFLGGWVPSMLISPLVFAALSLLTIIYTLLTCVARSSGQSTTDSWQDGDEDD
jgi:hypothetical protein